MANDQLHLTDTELAGLWSLVQAKRRAGTSTLKVPADWLEHVLKDHHTLVTALQSRKLLQVVAGPDLKSLSA